jgi:DNA-binding XRE family transcriptional regulator
MTYTTTLRGHRKSAELTQQQVADAASIHRNTYLDYELGNRLPPLDVARRLADILSAEVESLWPADNQ